MPNLPHELQRVLALHALLASADCCAEGDRVCRELVMPHLAQEFQRLLPLRTLLASSGRSAKGDSVWRELSCHITHK